jgi:Ca2+-binding RTX toxin-like protein
MSMKLVALVYVFVALAIVSKGEGIAPIVHAQLWFSSPNIQNQNSNDFNTYNKNSLHPNSSNCITAMSDIHDSDVSSALNGLLSSSKISANCGKEHFFNSCHIKIKETLRHANVIKPTSTHTITTTNTHTTPTPTPTPTPTNTDTTTSSVQKITTSSVQKICGTEHDDYIIGTEEDDIIIGLHGNDVIMALGGDDIVFAGPGDDTVYGGDGNNQLFGGEGNDNLVGGSGDDLLVGGPGNDRLYGNAGDDILQGGQGADYFDCGDGLDTVVDYNPSQGDVVSSNCENVNLIH